MPTTPAPLATALAALAFAAAAPLAAQAPPPNIVLIITDDLGAADLGVYGSRDIRTPHLDRLAREGVRFTDFYANATTCTPTRAGLITGRYQQRHGIEVPLGAEGAPAPDPLGRGLEGSPASLPARLKAAGYATALIGKWHLGYAESQGPRAHGFDEFFGLKSGYHDYWRHTDSRGRPDLWDGDARVEREGYSTALFAARAVDFIARHAGSTFFLDVAFNAPHWPFQRPDAPSVAAGNARFVRPADSATSSRADYVSMVEAMDRGVGAILAALERHGISRNTLVIFTNDNGGEWLSDNGPYFNRKWTTWEGGIRVPAIMRWPARVPAGRVTPQVGITMDLTATVLAAAGAPPVPAAPLDGIDLLPVLTGASPIVPRTLFWRSISAAGTMLAVRRGDWKLVTDANHQFLFDVRRDPGERRDLARARPDSVRALRLALAAWEAEVGAGAGAGRPGVGGGR
ncbi:MAG: sulfatase-like hydrolase/transferase [Gemmatimonadales bacterium]|nr:sulfatase-like hydrolase/transferase [Gemmatimonadales bacterium]